MSNFKSGSGNLDFGGNNKNDKGDTTDESASSTSQGDNIDEEEATDTPETEQQSSTPTKPDGNDESAETVSDQTVSDQSAATDQSTVTEYPYFVRRNNVGDERDTRLEIHVRDKVAEGEAGFRSELAEELETNDVSKTDAREFALLAAFRHPERVAELMEEEGFGTLG